MFSSNVLPKRRARAARSDCAPLQRWEDEGGHQSADDAGEVETDRGERAVAELGWSEFLSRFFPERRRHDLEALEAYATYRSEGVPARTAVANESREGATR